MQREWYDRGKYLSAGIRPGQFYLLRTRGSSFRHQYRHSPGRGVIQGRIIEGESSYVFINCPSHSSALKLSLGVPRIPVVYIYIYIYGPRSVETCQTDWCIKLCRAREHIFSHQANQVWVVGTHSRGPGEYPTHRIQKVRSLGQQAGKPAR